jgi:AcrR family transcriptional regulator
MGRAPAEERPYHHGDLRHALIAAGRRLLETQGPIAVTLRGVAREAGVSPTAPYHHFQDKQQLLEAIAQEGWTKLEAALEAARAGAGSPREAVNNLGVAYVTFARDNAPLYRLMYDAARDRADLPDPGQRRTSGAYGKVRETLVAAGADPGDSKQVELITAAAWCFAHGLAEMAGFRQFEHLKALCGGETPFLGAMFRQLGLMDGPPVDRER